MDVEARLRASFPAPPDGLREAILREAKRRARHGRDGWIPLAAAILFGVALFMGTRPDARLGGGQDAARVERLIERLGDPDPAARDEAFLELRDLGPAAREALTRALKSPDPEIRDRAARLLEDVALLPVDKALRDALGPFTAGNARQAVEALGKMLKVEREALLRALEIVAREGRPRARARADALRHILVREAWSSIRYGLVPLDAEFGREERTGALEIWINDSPDSALRGGWMGSDVDYFADGDPAGELVADMGWIGDGPDEATLDPIPPGGHAVHVWDDLLHALPRRPGRFVVRHHVRAFLLTKGENRERGLVSNALTLRIR